MLTLPVVGRSNPCTSRKNVVLPAPLGPTITQSSDLTISKFRLRRTSTELVEPFASVRVKVTDRFSALITRDPAAPGKAIDGLWIGPGPQRGYGFLEQVRADQPVEIDLAALRLGPDPKLLHV